MALEALADTRVVVVNGARQVGKSTLARSILDARPGAKELYLDDPAVLDAAREDPVGFVRHDELLLIDEVQRAPELLLPIKREVDRDPRPGRYLLTGSARLLDLRDLPDALPGRAEAEMRRLLSVVAGRMGGLAVPQALGSDVGMSRVTLSRYLDLLELVFVIKRIPAWSSNATTRAIGTPKLLLVDSGLGGRLIGMAPERAMDPTSAVGPLLENFAVGEIARQLTWADEPVQLFHYRDRDKIEVDAVLEHACGDLVGVEIKAAETVRGDDFRGLRHLESRLGRRFLAGFVLYSGQESLSFGDRFKALPLAALWQLNP
jgi:predicted AAA+ superfamily ATPase